VTKDDIKRMAWEAGSSEEYNEFWTFSWEELERFFRAAYAAGAKAERECKAAALGII
jgi:hypothetical protein